MVSAEAEPRSAVTGGRAHRRRAALVRQLPTLVVLAVAGTGLGFVFADREYERGSVVFAAAICLAAVFRAILPVRLAGLLRVRSRWTDVTTLAILGVGGLLAALALIYDWDADPLLRWFRDAT
ncbi:MAG TPA: DUF3017 domain-containing protein [Jiangellaceae bacterium]|nr:DUF3017 domain-containing protein [Jiangellaceae bacterium]